MSNQSADGERKTMKVYFDRIRHGEGSRSIYLHACLYEYETGDLAISADMPYCLEKISERGWTVVAGPKPPNESEAPEEDGTTEDKEMLIDMEDGTDGALQTVRANLATQNDQCPCGHQKGDHWHRASGVEECGFSRECGCKKFGEAPPVSEVVPEEDGTTKEKRCDKCNKLMTGRVGARTTCLNCELGETTDSSVAPTEDPCKMTDKEYEEYINGSGRAKWKYATPKPDEYECFRDLAYYDMWCVRKVGERRFEYGWHVSSEGEARALCEELSRKAPLEREMREALEQALDRMESIEDERHLDGRFIITQCAAAIAYAKKVLSKATEEGE